MTIGKDQQLWAENEEEYLRLREAVVIDQFSLDTQLSTQPSLFLQACDLYVSATDRRDFFKDKVGHQLAAAAAELRASGEYKSETAIKEAAEHTPDVRAIKARLAFWVNKTNLTFSLREAIDQRGKMLKELAHLFVSGYYQTSAVGATEKQLEQHEHMANRQKLTLARKTKGAK
jgi:hypothetical protein